MVQKDLLGIPNGTRKELFISDEAIYGGARRGKRGEEHWSRDGRIEAKIPAIGFVILSREV